ncbi:MAG: DUF4091 domain-containing protein [Lentisphaerae bacterium]|nr:DUF4091 domain-containing protein [Lentisphaerota bacterium]
MKAMIGLGLAATLAAGAAVPWADGLYIGNGGDWRQRIAITVTNAGGHAVEGAPVELGVGAGPGEIALAGAAADAIRVCDSNGTEFLWAIRDAAGRPVRRGPIPSGATLIVPVECPSGASTALHVYFDNPSAWAVPDFLDAAAGFRNGGVEAGEGDTPEGWAHDGGDDAHVASWSTERPRSGAKCLKTVVAPGAEPTWIATRQHGIGVAAGARYVFRAWVRAEGVTGSVGWYVHVGNAKKPLAISPMATVPGGTFDWREVKLEFTAPADADRADLGTVLRGTGAAWFDDASLERLDASPLRAAASAPERRPEFRETGGDAPWPADEGGAVWTWRFPVRVRNPGEAPLDAGLLAVDLAGPLARLHGRADPDRIVVTDGGRAVPFNRLGTIVLFPATVEGRSLRTFHVCFRPGDGRASSAGPAVREYAANPALPGGETREAVTGVERAEYERLLSGAANLARNPSFESGAGTPEDWTGAEPRVGAGRADMAAEAPGLFGARAVRMTVPSAAAGDWRGWRQTIPVGPGQTLLFASWLKCRDLAGGGLQLHAHCRTAAGAMCSSGAFQGAGPGISGTRDWTLVQGLFTMPADAARFDLHLTMNAAGTAWHDGVVVCRVTPAVAGGLQTRPSSPGSGPAARPVNAIVKVFRDDAPPASAAPARLSAARGEREALQIAVRGPRAVAGVRVEAPAPRGRWGRSLPAPEIGVVGYVPVDHVTSYYQSDSPAWHRKFPTRQGASDGWPGWWPDPILPRDGFDLAANETQPVWLTFRVPADARPGEYRGTVRFAAGGAVLAEAPYTVRVWNFALPDERHVKAIYDVRPNLRYWQPAEGTADEVRRAMWRFMSERRLCPDTIRPEPKLAWRDGKVEADFAAFDEAAAYYFDELHMPHMYTPWMFYGFGWGHPPSPRFGETPYEGESPYEGADRAVLRPEFKRAYQACLKAFWDHLKARGWDRKCVLYISDEPYDSQEPIRRQMKALCDMIHEVDRAIPVYCSTWHHQPEWDGVLDVWGVGHDGRVPVAKLAEIRKSGARVWWTTDGQMCTDTPYCAIERMLPHYCFKYGAEAYEFWGIDWLTYDPYEFGWHAYIHQSGSPGTSTWVRYPAGDGYLAYPGRPFGRIEPVPSIRSEQAGEGSEDYEYLHMLRERIEAAARAGRATGDAVRVLAAAQDLVSIPNSGGRYSTRFLSDPDAVFRVKEEVARAIEALR